MESVVKQRSVLRRLLSKTCNEIEEILQESDIKKKYERISKIDFLDELHQKLINLDKEIQDDLIKNPDFNEIQLEKELEDSYKYTQKWKILHEKTNEIKEKQGGRNITLNRNYKLPTLELQKFDGDIKNWLTFWGQFRKIHDDKSMDPIDKLAFLIQSTQLGTEVRSFVESFPANEKSYDECVDELKSRYARDELLIQIYVRELLNIVMAKDKSNSVVILYDKINTQLRALATLGVTRDKYAAFLLPLIESALPNEILKIWERNKPATNNELDELMLFLKREVESEQRIKMVETSFKDNELNVETRKEPTVGCFLMEDKPGKKDVKAKVCIWCKKDNHNSLECYKVMNMSLEERQAHLKKIKACPICLKQGHHPRFCKAFVKCYVCSRRHSPVMCAAGHKEQLNEKTFPTLTQYAQNSSITLLQTLMVTVSYNNERVNVRALIDNGAQRSYIRQDIAESLKIPVVGKEILTHTLFSGVELGSKVHNVYEVNVKGLQSKFSLNIVVLDQKCISKSIPKINDNDMYLKRLLQKNKIELSDKDEEIGLLIGADFSGLIMSNIVINLENNMLAIQTKLGWVLQGKQSATAASRLCTLYCKSDVSDFWSLELLGIKDPIENRTKAQNEVEAVLSFEKSIKINDNGRYEVTLPWKPGYDELLSNRAIAERRLESTTRRLASTGKLNDYFNVFRDWVQEGIIEEINTVQNYNSNGVHYLPHRGVIKDSSLTTKLRPVFDASARDSCGRSLNSCLNKGINFVDKIPNLLIGFRKGQIGITADIAKAFLMISIAPCDRDYLRFLWWKDENCTDIIEYRHCRVVFGLTSSPFLLSATIDHHLNNITGDFKSTASVLRKSFYVDNTLTSLDSEDEVKKFILEAKQIMSQGKFNLRQWMTSPRVVNENEENVISVLGLQWYIESDVLGCNLTSFKSLDNINKITKRCLMSITQSFFDPIGFICPTTLILKLMIRECWRRKLSWDEELPKDLMAEFKKWYVQIHFLEQCRIPRRLTIDYISECELSLHMFCDASKDAYSACIFLRAQKDNRVSIQLISAKTRVASPEKCTIPRLELMAALIGSRLLKNIREYLIIKCREYCWTDSCVSLCWIKKELPWNTFIGNRVKEIRQNSGIEDWYHIPGKFNPADLGSRGCYPEHLLMTRWWEGPTWLRRDAASWPKSIFDMNEEQACIELSKINCNISCMDKGMSEQFCNISRYTKIIRVCAWIRRYMYNLLNKYNKCNGDLSCDEYKKAELNIILLIQKETKEIIQKRTTNINTFLDSKNILRIKTKLLLADIPEATRTPILLPADHSIVRKLVEYRHLELKHAGINQLIADLRKDFWILGIRRLGKSVISKCVICRRYRAKPIQVTTAPLPVERITCSKPFEVTGIDLTGPLLLKDGKKCWIVIYTCAVYRAVHFELCSSLSTEAFILTLRRFIARRGRVVQIITDNGTNFTRAKQLLTNDLNWDEVKKQSAIQKIAWKLNSPAAPWWGGFWERLIRILKEMLRRVLGKAQVCYDELQTVLYECEAVINGRPLTYVQDDQNSALEPLTPANFIQPISETDITDLDQISLKSRYKYLQKLREDFKCRFKNEYLNMLIERTKDKSNSLKIGDIVLIETEEKRVKWPLGLVVNIFSGNDGISRTAEIKTSIGTKVRPFQKLYPMEICSVDVERMVKEKRALENSGKDNLGGELKSDSEITNTKTRSGRLVRLPSRYKLEA